MFLIKNGNPFLKVNSADIMHFYLSVEAIMGVIIKKGGDSVPLKDIRPTADGSYNSEVIGDKIYMTSVCDSGEVRHAELFTADNASSVRYQLCGTEHTLTLRDGALYLKQVVGYKEVSDFYELAVISDRHDYISYYDPMTIEIRGNANAVPIIEFFPGREPRISFLQGGIDALTYKEHCAILALVDPLIKDWERFVASEYTLTTLTV